MKRYLLLVVLAGCNPASCVTPADMAACAKMCGAPGVESIGGHGCRCKPGTPVVTTTTTIANPEVKLEKAQ